MSGRALIVDDHIEMAQVVAEYLADLGWTCTTVDSGAAAIAALGAGPFDVEITDLRLA